MVETPYVLIRQDAVERNIAKMAALAAENGVKLRPHVKTHKMPHLAELQLRAGACGITVAKVGEAEVMAEHGIRDMFIAYPIVVPSKIERAVRLARSVRLAVGVDSLAGAQALSRGGGARRRAAGSARDRDRLAQNGRRTGIVGSAGPRDRPFARPAAGRHFHVQGRHL